MLSLTEAKSYDFNKHLLKDFTKLEGKIGIVGLSGDPVHLDHIGLGEAAEKDLQLDYIVYMPTPQNPLKKEPLFSENDRVDMLLRAVAGHENFYVSTVEMAETAAGEKSRAYTIDSVKLINKLKNPKAEIYLIMGADSLTQLHLWKDFHELLEAVKIVPIKRGEPKSEIIQKLKKQKILTPEEIEALSENWVDYKTLSPTGNPISSTYIRKQLEAGQIPLDFLSPLVIQYLDDNF